MSTVLVVDGANVVGSRPDGWWKDRAGAARRLHEHLVVADTSYDAIVTETRTAAGAGHRVTVVTADRALQARVEHAGAVTLSPSWLLAEIE